MRTKTRGLTLTVATMTAATVMVASGCSSSGTGAQKTAAPHTLTTSTKSAPEAPSPTSPGSTAAGTSSGQQSAGASASSGSGSKTQHSAASGHKTATKTPTSPARAATSTDAAEVPASAPPTTAPTTQKLVLNKLPGTARTGTCVNVGSRTDVTSGTVAMGNFRTAQKSYKSQHGSSEQPTVSLYVIPTHRSMPPLRITMTPVTAKGKTRTITTQNVEQADVWKYYAVQLPVSSPGTWRLKVSAGSDNGCFDVSFHG